MFPLHEIKFDFWAAKPLVRVKTKSLWSTNWVTKEKPAGKRKKKKFVSFSSKWVSFSSNQLSFILAPKPKEVGEERTKEWIEPQKKILTLVLPETWFYAFVLDLIWMRSRIIFSSLSSSLLFRWRSRFLRRGYYSETKRCFVAFSSNRLLCLFMLVCFFIKEHFWSFGI